jgi:hypothetical protein
MRVLVSTWPAHGHLLPLLPLIRAAEQAGHDVVIAAARTGARHVVHGLGPLAAEAWEWFGARFADLCAEWDVPKLVDGILEVPYLDNCPPTLQADAVRDFRRRRRLRPTAGEVRPGEALPWDTTRLPYGRSVHLTLGTLFFGATDVFKVGVARARSSPRSATVCRI